MKLRFRGNTMRLRVNRREVALLASGAAIQETVLFPNSEQFCYVLEARDQIVPAASFEGGLMRVSAPLSDILNWAQNETIGLYFDLPAESEVLRVSIEKDLACVDGPAEEFDPEAFPRAVGNNC
jgi:hypothetical protein